MPLHLNLPRLAVVLAGHAPPPAMPQQGGGGMMAGLMGTVVQGAALGTGSAMAHRAVDAVMGPRTVQHEHVGGAAGEAAAAAPQAVPTGPCGEQVKGFTGGGGREVLHALTAAWPVGMV